MSSENSPVGFLGKMNANVLMTVTPEYRVVKAARSDTAGKPVSRPLTMSPEYRTVAGIRVRVAEGGNQSGPTVLLLSPLPESLLCFDPVWKKLGESFRLVALDMPGFGRSEGGAEYMNFAAQSKFLEHFVDAAELDNIHVVGPDVGMAAALHYVIHRDHRAASVIVGDGPAIVPSVNGSIINKAVDSGFWRKMFAITGAHAFVEGAFRLAVLNYRPSVEELADYLASYDGRIGTITEWFAAYPENLATIDPHLAELDLPVKLFWGDLDVFLLVDNAHALQQRLPRSELQVFEGSGHFSYQDKADEFAAMIIDWVGGGFRNV